MNRITRIINTDETITIERANGSQRTYQIGRSHVRGLLLIAQREVGGFYAQSAEEDEYGYALYSEWRRENTYEAGRRVQVYVGNTPLADKLGTTHIDVEVLNLFNQSH